MSGTEALCVFTYIMSTAATADGNIMYRHIMYRRRSSFMDSIWNRHYLYSSQTTPSTKMKSCTSNWVRDEASVCEEKKCICFLNSPRFLKVSESSIRLKLNFLKPFAWCLLSSYFVLSNIWASHAGIQSRQLCHSGVDGFWGVDASQRGKCLCKNDVFLVCCL